MAMKYKQVGGSPTAGLPKDFTDFLQQGLQTGSFGSAGATSQFGAANPLGSTGGISSVLNDILAGGAGKIGGSMAEMIKQVQTQNVNDLRARFGAGGGTSFGTPAAFAEAQYRATEAPQLTTAIGGLQESLLSQLLPIYAGITARGTPQAEITAQPNPWVQAAQLALPIAGAAFGASANPGFDFAPSPSSGAKLPPFTLPQFNSTQNWNLPGGVDGSQGGNWMPRFNPLNFGFAPSF